MLLKSASQKFENQPLTSLVNAEKLLKGSATFCLCGLLAAQWLFATYIIIVYFVSLATGEPEAINKAGKITGFVDGDTSGNIMLFAHVVPAALLSIGGILQLLPWLRSHYPIVHRWNGRVFLSLGLIGALSGLYLTWFRGSRLSDIGALGITLNGLLIPIAIFCAWRFARQKDFFQHARFATHAFLLINGVLFFRVFLMFWFIVNQGPNGNSSTLDGPMDIFLSYACYGLPMLLAELYFWAKKQNTALSVSIASLVLFVVGIALILGLYGAINMLWLPTIAKMMG
ncbi:MAG: DUF2306 domain-containing protein [Aestuariibacter sp.]